MKRIVQSFLSLVLVASALLLTACHKPTIPAPNADGTHPLTPYQQSLVRQIRRAGGVVIKRAEVLQIILPTDRFFRQGTTRLRTQMTYTVNKVAILVKSYVAPYAHPRIRVTGYTDNVYSRQRQLRVSKAYAREIAAYLWSKGVSERLVLVRGYGSKQPIASNRTPRGAAYNRRVVIRIN